MSIHFLCLPQTLLYNALYATRQVAGQTPPPYPPLFRHALIFCKKQLMLNYAWCLFMTKDRMEQEMDKKIAASAGAIQEFIREVQPLTVVRDKDKDL